WPCRRADIMLVRIGITLNLEPLRCSRSACNQRQAGAIPIGALVMVEPIRSPPANGWMDAWPRRIDGKRRHVDRKPLRLSIARTVESSRSIASMCPKTTYTVPQTSETAPEWLPGYVRRRVDSAHNVYYGKFAQRRQYAGSGAHVQPTKFR